MDNDGIQHAADRKRSPQKRSWQAKFGDAFRGIALAIRGQSSFYVHLAIAAAVVISAIVFRCSRIEWCILLACITLVMFAEAVNSALEALARAVDREYNEHLRRSLDTASGAVLICSLGAALIGLVIFVYRLGVLVGWWM
jgi:diacylglycerol kinase